MCFSVHVCVRMCILVCICLYMVMYIGVCDTRACRCWYALCMFSLLLAALPSV